MTPWRGRENLLMQNKMPPWRGREILLMQNKNAERPYVRPLRIFIKNLQSVVIDNGKIVGKRQIGTKFAS